MKEEQQQKKDIGEITNEIRNMPNLTEECLKPEDYAVRGGYAERIAKDVKEKVKTAQLRKFFNEIKRLHQKIKPKKENADINDVKTEVIKLIPELIFARGRKVITGEFYDLLEACLLTKDGKKCRFERYEEFENFVFFLEAIVAYHKAYA